MNYLVKTEEYTPPKVFKPLNDPYYFILLFDGAAKFSIDFTEYSCSGKTIIFLSPYQVLKWEYCNTKLLRLLRFHGDFYCIEYHKKEVACNGILFNNIYEAPFVNVSDWVFDEINLAFQKIKLIEGSQKSFDHSIIKSYLQLILAWSSKEKQSSVGNSLSSAPAKSNIISFQTLLEQHFIINKSVSFYATYYGLSVSAFSKQVKKQFSKTPSQLIQERLILESKRLLHLTYKSVKEIAGELGFEDGFYFSRFFKKEVGVSPKTFRDKVGISIVAK